MPGPRLPVRKIRDVLRLSAAGMSKRPDRHQPWGERYRRPGLHFACAARRPRLAAAGRPDGRDAGGSALSAASARQQGTSTAAGLGDSTPRAAPAGGDAAAVVGGASRRPPDGYGYSRYCKLYRAWEGRLSPMSGFIQPRLGRDPGQSVLPSKPLARRVGQPPCSFPGFCTKKRPFVPGVTLPGRPRW